MKYSVCLLLCFVLLGCKKDIQEKPEGLSKEDSLVLTKPISVSANSVALDEKPKKFALTWVEFITAQNEMENLKNESTGKVIANAEAISQIMTSLRTSLPDSLRSNGVESRLNVVTTKAKLLEQYSGRKKPDPKLVKQTAEELYTEFNNLKIQMNEIFLETIEDFERRLDEFEENERMLFEGDSIENAQDTVSQLRPSE